VVIGCGVVAKLLSVYRNGIVFDVYPFIEMARVLISTFYINGLLKGKLPLLHPTANTSRPGGTGFVS
jgi:hypothetical protein